MKAIRLTREEAYEAVMAGADNIMCLEYFEGGCECHGEDACWVGIQKGDEWQEHWKTFEAWV